MALTEEEKKLLKKIANTIRQFAMDATQRANSGHPGMPMGCAELGAYLYGRCLRHNPKNSQWINRDRLILSAGHGSMWLYTCLHLAGFHLSLEEIRNFRQLHSQTPGHPESLDTDGVETTTGPLGQGFGNAVGEALGLKLLAEKFNTPDYPLIDNKVFVVAGDGDMMEGVSSEASSLAGHLVLDNLIVIYDANHICLDGPLSETMSEDTKKRYCAYGWDTFEIDGHDFDALEETLSSIREGQKRPCLIVARTVIGKGAPNKAGTHKAHGSPLGKEEVEAAKKALGLPEEEFYIPQAVLNFFEEKRKADQALEEEWRSMFQVWSKEHPEKQALFQKMWERELPEDLEEKLKRLEMKPSLSGRAASHAALQLLAEELPQLYGGSADLSCSDLTLLEKHPIVSPGRFEGRNIKFGVREFAMGTMATGLARSQMMTPFIGTFLTFSDYMRNAIRLAALQRVQVIYQMTHDSVFLGEDGPTHQPVEHYAALRAIPNLHFIRPADNNEVKMAWIAALKYKGPTVLALSRQNLPELKETDLPFSEGVGRGAYLVRREKGPAPDFTLIATGSELALALDVANELEKRDKSVRVISMPCWEIFEKQEKEYQESLLKGDLGRRVSIEAGVDQGWHKYIGSDGIAICMDSFGLSAPYRALQEEFGFTVDAVLEQIL